PLRISDPFQQNAELRRTCDILLDELKDFKTALDQHAIVDATDADGKITCVNDRFCEISKYDREELLGHNHRIINSGYHDQKFFQDMWETIRRGEIWKGEIRNRAKDGSFYWEATTIVPLLSEDGTPRQYLSIRTDITQYKLAEEALAQSQSEIKE